MVNTTVELSENIIFQECHREGRNNGILIRVKSFIRRDFWGSPLRLSLDGKINGEKFSFKYQSNLISNLDKVLQQQYGHICNIYWTLCVWQTLDEDKDKGWSNILVGIPGSTKSNIDNIVSFLSEATTKYSVENRPNPVCRDRSQIHCVNT